MKKIFLFLLVSLLLVTPAFAESNLDLQLDIRFANLERIAKTLDVSMDYMSSYISSINGDSSKLNDFKSQFLSVTSGFKSAKTHQELDLKMQEAGVIVGKFWDEYKSQFDANKGKPLESLNGLITSLKNAKPEFDSLTERYWDVRIANVLQIYDNDVAGAEKLLPMLKNHPKYSQIESKLGEIKSARPELESALKSRNEAGIINAQTKIVLLAQELGNLVAGKG